jgi:flavin-binding protein dodecin
MPCRGFAPGRRVDHNASVPEPGHAAGRVDEEAAMPVMNTIELEGVSDKSWGDAAREALREASKTIRGINKLEVVSTGTSVRDGQIVEYRTQVRLYFTIEERG